MTAPAPGPATGPATGPARRRATANAALLAAMLIHNLTYPLAGAGGVWPVVFYLYYAAIFVAGTWALSADPRLRWAQAATGALVLCAGLANAAHETAGWTGAVLATSLAYHLVMCLTLALYVFRARTVMMDVVLAAATLYLVIGSGFGALMALIEWVSPGAFVAASGAEIGWRQMVYYSYVTLTTVGYGDITPVGSFAQSVASFEAVLGVLYTVILMSRLVGMSVPPADP